MQQSQRKQPGWRVLLLGGSSGVGKTGVAQALARQLGLSVLLVDDIRMSIQQVTTPAEQPGIHYLLAHPTIWQKPPEALCEGLITVGHALAQPLSAVIAHHVCVHSAGPIIIAGDDILPALAARRDFSSLHFTPAPVTSEVRAVFLVEQEEEILMQQLRQGEHACGHLSLREQETLAHAHWLYGQWIRRQAEGYRLPVVESRPWETLIERVALAAGE
jgi:2-phosphoglycerate kinase